MARQIAHALAQCVLALGARQRGDQIGERAEVHAVTGFDRFDSKGDGQVRLAGSGRAERVQGLVALDEAELRQRQDLLAI